MDCGSVSLLCTEEQEQLYKGDCYIIQYIYVEDGKDYHLFFAWSGQNSVKVRSLVISLLRATSHFHIKGEAVKNMVHCSNVPVFQRYCYVLFIHVYCVFVSILHVA